MKRFRYLGKLVFALLVMSLLAACGGSGGSGSSGGTNEVLISGRAAKGTILNATVRASQIINGQLGGVQKDVALGTNGDFSVSMPKGLVHLQVITQANSITQDEATGVAVALPPEFKFRAAADLTDVTATTVSLNMTPYSEAGVALAEKSGGLTSANINKANSGIANILGFDHLSTKPIQSSDAVGLANATTNEKKLSVLNAAVSNMASTDALGCGVKATYGQVIDCTVAKLADQFQMNSAASAQSKVVGLLQTENANSTPMVILDPAGYQGMVGSIANVLALGVTAFKNTVVEIVEGGIASGLSTATYVNAVAVTDIAPQTQLAEHSYQALLVDKWDLIRKANAYYKYAVMSNLAYEDQWVNGNSPGKKLVGPINTKEPDKLIDPVVADYTVLDWSKYGLGTGTGLQWGAFYNADEIVFAYTGTDLTSLLDWHANYNATFAACPESTPQYSIALNQFDTLLKMNANFKNDHGKKKVVLTGHSLGGGIASYIAMRNSSLVYKMVGFNSAPLCEDYSKLELDASKVNRIIINAEPVSILKFFYPGWPHTPYPNVWLNPITMHSMDTVQFAVRAAKKLCSTTPYCPEPEAPSNSSLPLAVDGLQSAYSTGVTPYRPAIQLSGSHLSSINQIAWACTQPNGTACPGSPYVWTPGNWAGKVDIINDTSIKVYPGLLALGDATGQYNWTATFSALNSTPVSRPFSVTYQPQIATGIVVESLSSTGFTPGTTTISTNTSPVVSALTVTGKNLGTVERVEWRWSGAASGSATWMKSDSTWNSKVTFTSDGKLILSPTVVEVNPAWSGTVMWTGTLINAAGASQNITFSVVYQSSTTTPVISSLSITSVPADSTSRPLIIYGSHFAAGNVVKYRWLNPAGSSTASATVNSATQISTNFNSGNVADTIYVKVCQSSTSTACSGELPISVTVASTPTAPSMPTANSPGSTSSPGTTISSTTTALSWSAVSGATYYDFGIRDMTTNQLVVSATSTGTSYSAALSSGKQYRWNVAACNSAGCSSYTAPLYFQTPSSSTPTAPAMPTANSPGSTSSPGTTTSSTTAALSWSAVSGATYYDFGIRDMTTNTLVVSQTSTGTSYSAALSSGKQYRWNVAACNSAGCSSYTAPLYFQTPSSSTPTAPAMPTANSPGSTSSPGTTTSSTTAALSWSAVSGATYYDFGVRDMTTNTLVVSATSTGTSYSAALSSGKQYRWNVAACNSAGCSSYTVPLYFQTPATTVTPSVSSLSPTSMTASTTALTTLTVNGANFSTSGGHLQFTDPFGATYSSASHPERVVSVTSTKWVYQINNGGTVGTWWVQVVNSDGRTSNATAFTVY